MAGDPNTREAFFTVRDAERIRDTVQRVLGDTPRPNSRRVGNKSPLANIRAQLTADLLPNSTASADMLVWDGSAMNTNGRTVTILDDGNLETGEKIQSGAKLDAYFVGKGAYHWLSTACTNIVAS